MSIKQMWDSVDTPDPMNKWDLAIAAWFVGWLVSIIFF